MTEPRNHMIKRLAMRSMRRGIKEMDLILSAFAQQHLEAMSASDLALYDRLLAENDHDIYGWVGGQFPVPDHYAGLITLISSGAYGVTRPV